MENPDVELTKDKPKKDKPKNDKPKDKAGDKGKTAKGKNVKAEEPKKAKPKGPGKAVKAAMQEILKARQEEEDRLKQQEEELQRQEEERERKRLEELRIKQEKKEREKQKLKEKIERQKKEGTYLTAKQKEKQKFAQARLEQLKSYTEEQLKKVQQQKSEEKTESEIDSANKKVEEEGVDEVDHSNDTDGDSVIEDWEDLGETKPNETKNTLKEKSKPKETVSPSKTNQMDDFEEVDKRTLPPPTGLRSPIICVLGHVDTGKTKLLDYLRKTHVQDNEAGGITQQIGATYVPPSAIIDQRKGVRDTSELQLPGLLIIDTPGHESFTNLRSRGSSLCDIAILVIDIMHGLEPQTIESINLLKSRKTPFVVALNKIDRLYQFKGNKHKDVQDVVESQAQNTQLEFEKRCQEVIVQLSEQGLNAALYYKNPDERSYISMVPTSAHSGDGMGNIINLLVTYSQTMLTKKLTFIPDKLECTVLEVKALPGLGTTIDVVLVNGKLQEGDKIVLAGHDGPICTHIRSLLVPQPMRELRVKSPYQELKCVYGSMGIKVTGQDLEKAVAGLELSVGRNEAELEKLKEDCWKRFGQAMKAIKCSDKGVHVQASTLGSLEALLQFLKESKIPYANVRIGPVVKRDVMKASTMKEMAPDYAAILAFDVRIEKDAQEMADKEGVKIFAAEIIYHLFDKFTAYQDQLKAKKKEQFKGVAVFPCKLRVLPQFVFNARDPIVLGVSIEDGIIVPGTPIAVPSKGNDISLTIT